MEAKDTVMNFMRIEEIDAKNATSNFTDALVDVAREQAEISFKAGYEQALKDYEEVLKAQGTQFDIYESGYKAGISIELKEWQAKRKEQIIALIKEADYVLLDKDQTLPTGVFDYEQHKRILWKAGWRKVIL